MLNRRKVLGAMAAGIVSARAAFGAEASFRFAGLDHLSISVPDVEKSVRFYARVFGNNVLKEKAGPRHYLKIGPNYIAIAPPGRPAATNTIDHFGIGIAGFDLAATKVALEKTGVKFREVPGNGYFAPDPDGTNVQIWTENSWRFVSEPAVKAEIAAEGEPLLQPTAIDHILINVTDVEKSAVFYGVILGPVINPASRPRRTWFAAGGGNRIGLGLPVAGQKPGIDHFCLTARFERARLSAALEAAGAKIIQGDVAAGIDFLDVNGIHVQVTPPA